MMMYMKIVEMFTASSHDKLVKEMKHISTRIFASKQTKWLLRGPNFREAPNIGDVHQRGVCEHYRNATKLNCQLIKFTCLLK